MAKKLNTVQVNMTFSADTKQAKMQMQDLQSQLNNLTKNTHLNLGVEEEIRAAISATAELSAHLQKATNVDTGNLDFAKLSQSLKASGKTLQEYSAQLQKLGPQGQQAFLTLAQSVASAEIPLKRTNLLVKEFWTTLQNTARWQLSSSVLHGFMGAIQSAYGYAQDLNESLNNIRIVTNRNTDEMARFAKEANKAAKALSATTTEYTNASLIYYQQGLSDKQVKERADVTVKLANVSRQSAETVSEQMTSVWNNFYNGSKSLEYYADVMTALGAATASSTEEIAGGLEKFAAVADTIGLSYEYAAAALATITSNTRQSEEVVGTALKTIFARIQGLNLGETLEDGTTLNKYSEALNKVGVNIYDTNGQLKEMDAILDDLGNKWNQLGKDQQVALAQTVAGVRQYNQLIALMDNWNKGDNDSFIANLNTANAAAGSLQQQADIYAESWEAAADRVTAAAESLYDKLIDDEFFIDLLNNVEKVLSFIDQIIDGLGGLQGVLLALGTVVTKVFATQISQGLTTLSYNLQMSTEKGRQKIYEEREKFIKDAQDAIPASNEYTTKVEIAQKEQLKSSLVLQSEYLENAERMSELEKIHTKSLMERTQILRDQNVSYEKQIENIGILIDKNKHFIMGDVALNNENAKIDSKKYWQENPGAELEKIKEYAKLQSTMNLDISSVTEVFSKDINIGQKILEQYKQTVSEVYNTIKTKNIPEELSKAFQKLNNAETIEEAEEAVGELNVELEKLIQKSNKEIKRVVSPEAEKNVDELTESLRKKAEVEALNAKTTREAAKAQEDASKAIKNAKGAQKTWSDIFVASTNAALSLASALQMITSGWETLTNPELTAWQKFTTLLTTTAMLLGTIVNLIQSLKTVFNLETVAKLANAAATWAQVAADKAHAGASDEEAKATGKNTKETNKNTLSKVVNTWNDSALSKSKEFELLDNGKYHKIGDPDNTFYSKEAAGKVAGKSAFKGLLTKLGGVALIAAGVMIAAATVKGISDYIHKAEKELEKTKKVAAELNNHYSEIASKHNEFTQSLANYKSAQDGLKDLVKGTQEYKEAAKKANEEAMALLETNKNLKYEIVDGVIQFDNASLSLAEKTQQEQLLFAQGAKMAGQQAVTIAEENITKRDYARKVDSGEGPDWAIFGGSMGGGALAGGAVAAGGALLAGLASGPVGWAALIGAAIGLAAGGVIGGIVNASVGQATVAETKALEKIANAYKQDSSILAESPEKLAQLLNIDNVELVSALTEDTQELKALCEEINQNSTYIAAQNDLLAAQLLANNITVQESKYKDETIDLVGDINEYLFNEKLQALNNDNFGVGIAKVDKTDAFSAYVKETQQKNLTYLKTTGSGDDRIYHYLDADGNEKQISLQAMKIAIASAQAARVSEAKADDIINLLEIFEKNKKKDLVSFVGFKSFNKATGKELQNLLNLNSETISIEDLQEIFGVEDLTEFARTIGYSTAEELLLAFRMGLKQEAISRQDLATALGLEQDNIVMQNLSTSTGQAILDQMTGMNYKYLYDSNGNNIYTSMIQELLTQSGLDDEKMASALELISRVDFTQFNAAYDVIKIINALGGSVQGSEENFKAWVAQMNLANSVSFDFTQLLSDLRAIDQLVNQINLGDIISIDDYNLLLKYNKGLAEYFTLLNNEKAQLTGDPLAFLREVKLTEKTALNEALEKENDARQVVQDKKDFDKTVSDTGYSRGSLSSAATEKVIDQEERGSKDPEWWQYVHTGLAHTGMFLTEFLAFWDADEFADVADELLETNYQPEISHMDYDKDLYKKQLEFIETHDPKNTMGNEYYTDTPTVQQSEDVAAKVKQILDKNPALTQEEINQLDQSIIATRMAKAEWYNENAEYFSTLGYVERKKMIEDDNSIEAKLAYLEATDKAIIAEKWDNVDVEAVKSYADSLVSLGEAAQEAGDEVALFGVKTQMGLNTLKDNFDEWNYLLQNSERHSLAYSQSLTGIKTALSDLLGVDEEFITEDFVLKNLNLIDNVINNGGSIEDLQTNLAVNISEGFGKGAKDGFKELEDYLNAKNLEIGVNLKIENDQDLKDLITKLSTEYQLSPDEIRAYLGAQGYEVNFATETYREIIGSEEVIKGNQSWIDADWVTENLGEWVGEKLNLTHKVVQPIYADEEKVAYKLDENGIPIVESITKVTDDSTVSPPTLEEALDKLTEAMQLKLEINDRDLEILDYKLSKIKDDFYSMAEGIGYLLGTFGSIDGDLFTLDGSKLDIYNDSYKTLYDTYRDIIMTFGISKKQITEKLNEVFTATMNNLKGLQELDNTMINYYSETLALASKELENYTKQMKHHTDVLEHYKNLLSLTGKENDYKALDTVLKGQAQVAKNQAAVSKATYEMHKNEVDYWAQEMEKAQKSGNTEGYELYRKNWLAAQEAARESQNQMLSDLEAWAEAEKEILKNTLADLGKELEKALTGGMSFDELSTSMQRTASLQEEYLTATNQIYETTKMMRTAQQAIDTSTNTIAKNKLKAFITETKSMQEQTKLSQYELDIQQAKYNLLVAEIALEEAQNAKSTVRLQRDAEGNFGYVYTADTTAVSEAQQQFDDAQNALYNIGLNGANNYAQNYTATLQEMYDTLQQINENRMNGLYATEEEYNNAMAAAKEYYYAKLQNYSNLYSIALTADSKIVSEAWSTDFGEMIESTETWKTKVENYLTQANSAFTAWASAISQIEKDSGLNNLSQAVGNITTESNNLKNTLLGTEEQDGVIDALDKELNKVNTLVTSYGLYRTAVQGLITDYENLIDILNKNMDGKVYIGVEPSILTEGGSTRGGAPRISGELGYKPNVLTNVALNDDGGYTGSWGPEGKWAILHEEEMILTKDETKQFFNNLSIMENILSTLDSYALNQQTGGLLMSPYYRGMDSSMLEQNVHIEASFPSVTDRNEIEEAFNNLVNKASQYANRK